MNAEALGDSRSAAVNCSGRVVSEEIIRAAAYSALKSMQILNDAVGVNKPAQGEWNIAAPGVGYRRAEPDVAVHAFHAAVSGHGAVEVPLCCHRKYWIQLFALRMKRLM